MRIRSPLVLRPRPASRERAPGARRPCRIGDAKRPASTSARSRRPPRIGRRPSGSRRVSRPRKRWRSAAGIRAAWSSAPIRFSTSTGRSFTSRADRAAGRGATAASGRTDASRSTAPLPSRGRRTRRRGFTTRPHSPCARSDDDAIDIYLDAVRRAGAAERRASIRWKVSASTCSSGSRASTPPSWAFPSIPLLAALRRLGCLAF